MGILKSYVPSGVLLGTLRKIALRNVCTTFESDDFKILDVKLYEKDTSGERIEVDLIDEDSLMAFPIEQKTRFIVYLTKTHLSTSDRSTTNSFAKR